MLFHQQFSARPSRAGRCTMEFRQSRPHSSSIHQMTCAAHRSTITNPSYCALAIKTKKPRLECRRGRRKAGASIPERLREGGSHASHPVVTTNCVPRFSNAMRDHANVRHTATVEWTRIALWSTTSPRLTAGNGFWPSRTPKLWSRSFVAPSLEEPPTSRGRPPLAERVAWQSPRNSRPPEQGRPVWALPRRYGR